MHFHIHYWLQHYGYGGIFFILMAETIGLPFPTETTLTFIGIEWIKGEFSLLPILIVATNERIDQAHRKFLKYIYLSFQF